MSNISSRPSGRLASLDVLRGFDLFLLVFLQPVLWGLFSQWESPLAQALLFQLDHEIWEGFRCWDLVMPLFLFMSGISMPFALSKYLRDECPRGEALRKVLRRFVILFLLGMVVQGNLLWLKWEYVQPFTNTLQAIAVGYLVTALILLSRLSLGRQMLVAVGLLAAYTIPMMWVGDYTMEGNLACRIDALVLGSRRGDPTYAWLLPSLNFAVTVWLGAWAGQLIRRGGVASWRTSVQLAGVGLLLIALGLLWSLDMPIVKRIWTSSMTLYSGGWCFLLMAAFYQLIDVWQVQRPFAWLKVYGMNSIVAYVVGEVVNFRSIVESVSYGLAEPLGSYYTVWLTFGNFLFLFLILALMYRARIFVKV